MQSSLRIFKDIEATQFVKDVTELGRQTYRRTAKGIMGDDTATFTITGPEIVLRSWFETWLGYWFREYVRGIPELSAFTGQIYTMRLFANGRIYRVSLNDVVNKIIVQYTTSSGGSTQVAISPDTSDSDRSKEKYGRREQILNISSAIDSSTATAIATSTVDKLNWPIQEISGFSSGSKLMVTVVGTYTVYSAVRLVRFNPPGTLRNVSDDIKETVIDRTDLTTYDIATNTNQVLDESPDYPKFETNGDRFRDDMRISGSDWRAGCYGEPLFRYYQLNREQPKYRMEIDKGNRVFYDNSTNVYIPNALVKPGQYVQVAEVSLGLPTVFLLDGLTYSTDGLQFSLVAEDRLAIIEQDLQGKI
ncbi:MAG TPA: hypothetical protein EYH05_18575 [Anaerolineae bacterium]|nr:hypothetical protein [Anaerolineae bacterium]